MMSSSLHLVLVPASASVSPSQVDTTHSFSLWQTSLWQTSLSFHTSFFS